MTTRIWFLLVVLAMVAGLFCLADTQAQAAYPNVSDLKPYSVEANYMSLAGYLRWQVYMEQGVWISRGEAMEIVMEQQW